MNIKKFEKIGQKTLLYTVITSWIFLGMAPMNNFSLEVKEAEAAGTIGDVYIARAPGTNLVTNIGASEVQLTYDTEVASSTNITRQSGNQAFRIQNSGRYLIIANTRFTYTPISNNQRHIVRTQIKIGGTVIPSVYGMASGYGRDSGSADEDGAVVVAYIDHTVAGTSADDITFHVQNFGYTSNPAADQTANQSGIQIIRMPDDSEYLKIKNTTAFNFSGSLGYGTGDPTWNELGWTTQDVETDNSVIEWVSGNDITLKSEGHYLVIYSVDASGSTPSNRAAATYRLKLNDTEISASRVVSYMRDYSVDSSEESWVQWAGIINASSSSVLNIDWASVTENAIYATMNEAAITVVKLPDTADYVRVRYDSNRAGETTGAYPFNQEDEDTDGVHDNSTNNSRISGNSDSHDWLLFGSWFARNAVADGSRVGEHFRWYRTGSEVQFGSGLSYHRGDQSTYGVPASGRNAAIVALNLGASDYIEMNLRQEAGTGNQNRDFIGNRVGITGIALDTMYTEDPPAEGDSLPTPVPGRVGQAIKFDSSSSQYFNLGTGLDQNGELTLAVWIRPTTVSLGAMSIIANSNDAGTQQDYALELNRTAGKISTLWASSTILTGDTNLSANEWYHVAMTRAGSSGDWTIDLYLNGVNDGSTTSATNPNATNATTSIAKFGGEASGYFDGAIDEVRLYNRALTGTEIYRLYKW